MRNVTDKCCRENQNTHFMFAVFDILAVYEIMWSKIGRAVRQQMTTRRTRVACRKTKATNPLSEYVILIAFPLQQWLHERASMELYTYIASLVSCVLFIFFCYLRARACVCVCVQFVSLATWLLTQTLLLLLLLWESLSPLFRVPYTYSRDKPCP